MEDDSNILEYLGIDSLDVPDGPTPEQRRALYRMGRSRSWVRKYARTREQASQLIDTAISEMTRLKARNVRH